jgi:hypothetical protein
MQLSWILDREWPLNCKLLDITTALYSLLHPPTVVNAMFNLSQIIYYVQFSGKKKAFDSSNGPNGLSFFAARASFGSLEDELNLTSFFGD